MIEPIFPLLGMPPNLQILDPMTVFTPLTVGLIALCSLCGIALGVLIARADRTPKTDTQRSDDTPVAFPKAA